MFTSLAPARIQAQTPKPRTSRQGIEQKGEQGEERTSVAFFDNLGLLVHDCDASDQSDEVVFKMLQMKTLLASAFQLQGFERGVAIAPHQQNLVVEFQRHERRYEGFKS